MKRLFKKLILRIFIALIALTLLIVPALYLIALNSPTVSAAWFNDNWLHRKAVSTTIASNSSDLSNLQMLLTVDTSTGANGIGSGRMQASCQDLRFTNQAGKLLPYYIDSGCTTTTTKIWVMVDLVPKNTTTMTLYMYYGNPSAPAGSNSQPYFDNVVGLVGYWTLNDGGSSTTASDHSVSGNNGTLTIGASGTQTTATQAWTNGATGQYSASINLDGADDYIDAGASTSLEPTNALSVSAWVKKTSSGGAYFPGIFSSRKTYGNDGGYLLTDVGDNGKIRFYIRGVGGFVYAESDNALTLNQWYHLEGTWDGSTVRLYVNGALQSTTASTTSISYLSPATQNHFIGRYGRVGSGDRYFPGSIDDVKIYNTARTATQILNDYNNKLPNGQTLTIASTAPTTVIPTTSIPTDANAEKAPSPAAYWKFDDSQGQTAQDSTVNNNDGTLGATSGIEASDPTWQSEDMCVSGKCLKFDGTDDYVNVSNTVSGTQTVEMWVKPTSSTAPLITLNGTTNVSATSGTISATGFTLPTIYVNGKASSTLTANTWQHVAVTTGTAISASTIKIGNVSTSYLTGFIDDVKIYPYARSAAQILADYNSRGNNEGVASVIASATQGARGNLSDGLVGYWKMDEASANSCTGGVNDNCDSSGNGNNGAWNGDATSAAGKYGNGTTFDGTGDYVNLGNILNPGTNSITSSVWFKPTSLPFSGYQGILTKGGYNTSWLPGLFYLANNGTSTIIIGNQYDTISGVQNYSYNVTVTTGWNNLVVVRDTVNMTFNIYLNDSLVQSVAMTAVGNATHTHRLVIGGQDADGTNFQRSFNGQIDEVRIYNRALSPAEVSALYNFAPGPKVYLKMDEGTGTSANDSSGNGSNGTVNSGTWTSGKYGKGVNVSGSTGSNVSVSDFSY